MKIKSVILPITILLSLISNAQDIKPVNFKTSKFGFGLHSDLASIPLKNENYRSSVSGVHLNYNLTNDFNLKIGYENRRLAQTALQEYQGYAGAQLGIGYFLPKSNKTSNNDIELSLSATNAINGFSTFKDYSVDLGCRVYMFRSFYIGLGLRYSYDTTASFISTPINDLNAYWQLGFQWNIAKKAN